MFIISLCIPYIYDVRHHANPYILSTTVLSDTSWIWKVYELLLLVDVKCTIVSGRPNVPVHKISEQNKCKFFSHKGKVDNFLIYYCMGKVYKKSACKFQSQESKVSAISQFTTERIFQHIRCTRLH